MKMIKTSSRRVALIVIGLLAILASTGLAAEPKYTTTTDVVYTKVGDQELLADIYQPLGEGPFPSVLCVHGGAWFMGKKSQMRTIASRLAENGYVAVSISYRLAPQHKFPAQIEDCRTGLAWVRKNAKQYKIDPKRLAAWGYSAGGQLVALLGAEGTGLKAVVAGGAPCDFRSIEPDKRQLAYWLGGSRGKLPKVYKAASPAAFVSADDPPFFFYHGEKDIIVKIEQPKAMARLLTEAGASARVRVVPGVGHIRAFRDRQTIDQGIEFLNQHLR